MASSLSFAHTIYSFFFDLHWERGRKEGETGLTLKSSGREEGRRAQVIERPVLQVKIQVTEALSW